MLNKEALEYLVRLGYDEDVLVDTDFGLFSKINLVRIKLPKVETLQVSNLTSVIEFLKANIDEWESRLLIQVVSPCEVRVLTPLDSERDRQEILRASAILPNNIRYDSFIDTEQFNIMLQASFADKGDKALVLKFTGLIRDEAVKETGDNGISQKVTIKTGIASVGEAEVPNPVNLAPYRSFPEIDQVGSKFVFRMQEGPKAALYEADGGAWKNEAMKRIKEYLKENLKEQEEYIDIIS
ncbi:MAG: hypothetical protein RBR71_03625 [Gudongella sp.]|nr:hypothetical protein [Gudongella sp.]